MLFVAVFYGLLVLWTVGTVPFIWQRFEQGVFRGDWLYGAMIGFFYLYTWFWSLGLVSRISLDAEGQIELKSLRRTLVITAKEVRTIEGSRFSGGVGFVRMKLSKESVYLFCNRRNAELGGDLPGDRSAEPPDQDRPDISGGRRFAEMRKGE